MDWPSYVQQLLYGGRQQQSLTGGDPGPMLVAALQRFLAENSYAISMARQGAQIAQDVTAVNAGQNDLAMSAGLGTGVSSNGSPMNSDVAMAQAQAYGNAMIAQAGGSPGPMSGWDALRYTGETGMLPPSDPSGWDVYRVALETGVIPGSGTTPGWGSAWEDV